MSLPYSRLAGSFDGLTGGQARLAYAQSAAAVQKMIDLAGAPNVMALIADLGEGTPLEQAFERRLLISYDEFQAQLAGRP